MPVKFTKRPFKHSSLRKSINAEDAAALASDLGQSTESSVGTPAPATAAVASGGDDDEDGPVVVKPPLSRAGSTKQKKKRLSSRLSFGGDPVATGDDDGGGGAFTTPKKSGLSSRALENSALRNRLPIGGRQPTASSSHATDDDDDSRPRYSKEYLDELANSTPNTPRDLSTLRISGDYDEAMELDLAELDGALVVPSAELSGLQQQRSGPDPAGPAVLTEAEIRERKERRARLAREEDFMSLDGSDEDGDHISLRPKSKKKDESRLVAEDEDLGEGYEEFVEDGGLSLGKKAERDARRRRRAEIAELIDAAEGEGGNGGGGNGGSSDGDDSEAERRAAYEEAQTRAGMDGLRRRGKDESGSGSGRGTGVAEIPRLKPLPDLGECLSSMREVLQGVERDVAAKQLRIAELEKEKSDITAREAEVQTVLDQEGSKYTTVPGTSDLSMPPGSAAQSPLRPLPAGFGVDAPVQRGLESFGTPTKRPDTGDVG